MNYWTYVLISESTGKIYIGQTNNLYTRLKRNNKELPTKSTSYTQKHKGPWKLIYKERYNTRTEAKKREKQLKSYQGRKFIKKNNFGPIAQW